MTTLVLKNRQKNGGARYGLPGMRTSAYFPPSMFVGEPPASIDVDEPTVTATGPDGKDLTTDDGKVITKGTVFATEMKKVARTGGTTSGTRVNTELQAARAKAKELREQSKAVLREARQSAKAKRTAKAAQPPLVDEGTPANV